MEKSRRIRIACMLYALAAFMSMATMMYASRIDGREDMAALFGALALASTALCVYGTKKYTKAVEKEEE